MEKFLIDKPTVVYIPPNLVPLPARFPGDQPAGLVHGFIADPDIHQDHER